MSGPTARRGAGVCVMRERLLIAGAILALGPLESSKQQQPLKCSTSPKKRERSAYYILACEPH